MTFFSRILGSGGGVSVATKAVKGSGIVKPRFFSSITGRDGRFGREGGRVGGALSGFSFPSFASPPVLRLLIEVINPSSPRYQGGSIWQPHTHIRASPVLRGLGREVTLVCAEAFAGAVGSG